MRDTFKIPHALFRKATGERSVLPCRRVRLTEDEAQALNGDVLKHASVEWRPAEERDGAREAVRRSAK